MCALIRSVVSSGRPRQNTLSGIGKAGGIPLSFAVRTRGLAVLQERTRRPSDLKIRRTDPAAALDPGAGEPARQGHRPG